MRIAPSLPPPVSVEKEGLEVKVSTRPRASKHVQTRTLPPLVVQHRAAQDTQPDAAERQEQRQATHLGGGRRIYCRRLERRPFLLEMRSTMDRRLHKRRKTDGTEHIDEKA